MFSHTSRKNVLLFGMVLYFLFYSVVFLRRVLHRLVVRLATNNPSSQDMTTCHVRTGSGPTGFIHKTVTLKVTQVILMIKLASTGAGWFRHTAEYFYILLWSQG